jgi:hypothetical protein
LLPSSSRCDSRNFLYFLDTAAKHPFLNVRNSVVLISANMVEKLYVTYNQVSTWNFYTGRFERGCARARLMCRCAAGTLYTVNLTTKTRKRHTHIKLSSTQHVCVTRRTTPATARASPLSNPPPRNPSANPQNPFQVHKLCQEAADQILNEFKPNLMIAIGGGGYVPARILRYLTHTFALVSSN